MKSSRAMLLAAMLFVAPVFADQDDKAQGTTTESTQKAPKAPKTEDQKEAAQDAPKAPKAEDKKEAAQDAPKAPKAEDKKETATEASKASEKSMFVKARELAIAPFVFALATAPDYIAKNTVGRLAKIEYLKGGKVAGFLGHEYTGRAMVYTVAAVAAYKVYQAMNTQDETDEDDIFGE